MRNSTISGFYSTYAWTCLVLEEKRSKLQETIMDKCWTTTTKKDKIANETHMNMVWGITNFIDVMSFIIKSDKGKQENFPNHDFDDYNKEDG
jgi:hypothetical protein